MNPLAGVPQVRSAHPTQAVTAQKHAHGIAQGADWLFDVRLFRAIANLTPLLKH